MGNRFVRKRHPPEVLERGDSCGGSGGVSGELKRGERWTRLLNAGSKIAWPPEGGRYGGDVANYYLLKTEPSEYSFAELVKDRETTWDGVANPTAVMHMRAMKPGDRLVIYETGNVKSVVGTASVTAVDAKDPKNPVVKIIAGAAVARAISLDEIKKQKLFRKSPLITISRLSVVPLTAEQYAFLAGKE
jgi:predicted RNA-binding protein with PUA-like domain